MNALVAGNGSYIVWPCGHDLHGPTITNLYLFLPGLQSEILKPLAVIPLNEASKSDLTCLQQFAQASNSEMVYACDEFGNNLAVGLFVTTAFEDEKCKGEKVKHEDIEESKGIDLSEANWVGAVEECVTESKEVYHEEVEVDSEKELGVRIYKVNRDSRAKINKSIKKSKTLNTLCSLKEKKANKIIQKAAAGKHKKRFSEVKTKLGIGKRNGQKRHKRKSDKAFRPSYYFKPSKMRG